MYIVNTFHFILGADLDYQRTNDIIVRWSVEDPESGVEACHWAIGIESISI